MQKRFAAMLLIAAFALLGAGAFSGDAAKPANYPARPIEIIVPFAAGGGLDTAVRLVGKFAEKELGQRIVVSNKTGGGNIQGNMEGIKAKPDGYVIGAWGNGLVTDQLLVKGVPYTYKDVKPLCMFAEDPNVITVGKKFADANGIKTLKDLFEYAKKNPGKVTIGMGGNWTPHDFLRLKMEASADVKFNRMPFLGGAPALQSAAAGNCDVVVPFLPEILTMIDSGLVVPLAVAHPTRVAQLPDTPTTAEAGYPDLVQSIWRAFCVPKNTPDDIVAYLESVFAKTLKDPEFIEAAKKAGVNPSFKSSKELADFIEKEFQYFDKKTDEWGIKVK